MTTMHSSAYDDAARFVAKYLDRDQTLVIADIGSYDVNGTLRPLFDCPKWRYIGLDVVAGPNVDHVILYDWLNVDPESFDVIVSTMTLEHVPKPWVWIQRVAKCARAGALIYICAPNTWDYHEYPVDCWRIWPVGMKALFDEAGLVPVHIYAEGTDTTGIARKPGQRH